MHKFQMTVLRSFSFVLYGLMDGRTERQLSLLHIYIITNEYKNDLYHQILNQRHFKIKNTWLYKRSISMRR